MAAYLLGLDYGTGGAKACIMDEQGQVLAYAYREYPIIIERPGWSEHDPKRYWTVCCELIREVLSASNVDARFIRGIGTSSALPSLVMVDQHNEPVVKAYNLMDRRATKQVQWIKDTIGEERIFAITGNRLDDHPMLVNLLWERENRPQAFAKVAKVLTIDGFVRLKLTGRPTMHISAGPFYGVAYNIRTNRFDHDILEQLQLDPHILPEAFGCEEIIGEVTSQAAQETGLVAGIPVAAGQVDCNAGWIGAGAIEEGDIQANLGTCGNFGILFKNTDFIFSETGFSMINFAYTADSQNTFVTVPTTTTGGQSLRYIRDQFSQVEMEMERMTGVNSYDMLNLLAEKVPPGSDGLVILPYLMGERTPIWDVNARGVVFGLSLNHSKGHLIRAMMEAVAYALYDSFRLIKQANLQVNSPIVLNEGGARSRLWRRIITDVFHVPTVMVENRVGAPYGDAILAGVATGVFADFSVAKQWVHHLDYLEPIAANHNLYMEYFALYKDLYTHLQNDFLTLAKLRAKSEK